MKKLLNLVAVAAILFAGSCQKYNDMPLKNRVDDLENRVAVLEELCKQMNTNIASLQTLVSAAQAHDCITSVVPVESGGTVIGYTITFSQNAPITIYYGTNGTDGIAPVIGAKQDTDGVYYWTLDGEWLIDASGAKIPTSGANGQDGEDGANGKDGQNGITPLLKIENNGWYVSYNNGTNWTYLGQVPSGGTVATGDSMFRSVDTSHSDYVLFTLSNGTEIRVPKFGTLAITFTEGNSLLFDVDETKTINYTITGGGANNVVKAEMQNLDGNYTLYTTSTSATTGTLKIMAKIPSANNVIVSVSDGTRTVMTAIAVSIKPSFSGTTITVATPGSLSKLLADYDKTTIAELTVIGNLNRSDITTLSNLPNLAILDMEHVNLEELPVTAFTSKTSLKSVKLPRTLKTIGGNAFGYCSELTNVTIGNSVTIIGSYAFDRCSNLTSITIPDSVTEIGSYAFNWCSKITSLTIGNSVSEIGQQAFFFCSSLTSIYCKAQTPPITDPRSSIFNDWSQCTLYVPTGCKEAYATANEWKRAKEIIEMEF